MNNKQAIIYKEGGKYIIDKGHANEGEVEIVALISSSFAMIKDADENSDSEFEWPVKMNRLTEIEKQ